MNVPIKRSQMDTYIRQKGLDQVWKKRLNIFTKLKRNFFRTQMATGARKKKENHENLSSILKDSRVIMMRRRIVTLFQLWESLWTFYREKRSSVSKGKALSNTFELAMAPGIDSLKEFVRQLRENLSSGEILAEEIFGTQIRHSASLYVSGPTLPKLPDRRIDESMFLKRKEYRILQWAFQMNNYFRYGLSWNDIVMVVCFSEHYDVNDAKYVFGG